MPLSLRSRILVAILAAVIATDLLAVWVVHDRIESGARREANIQAQAQTRQAQALFAERGATLAAQAESVSLYPAVIAAIAGGNTQPLLQWSGQVAQLQGTEVAVVDDSGRVLARGRAPDVAGDSLLPALPGLRLALSGHTVSGVEAGDELGLALRGYAPALRDGAVVGAVMLAEPLNDRLLGQLAGDPTGRVQVRLDRAGTGQAEGCATPAGASTSCRLPLRSPTGDVPAVLSVTVPLTQIEQARTTALRELWLIGALGLVAGAAAAWLLANSLTRPLARLVLAAQRIAGGDYTQPTGVRSPPEIGALAGAVDTMRERVAQTTGALRDERDVLDAVLEAVEDGILLLDPAGTPKVANRRWTAMLGGPGLTSASALMRIDGDGGNLASAARSWLAAVDVVATAGFEQVEPYRRFRGFTAPVRRHDGARVGRIIVLRDVTRESEAERMRTALVTTVSHELRAPLTAITGYVDTLLNSGPWEAGEQREFLAIVSDAAAQLSGLVDNLLDAAKLEAGVVRLECEPVRVERIAEEVVARRRSLAPDRSIQVEAERGLLPAEADPMRVEQVIANLVDNAIKYSPAGSPIRVHVDADPSGMLRVSVSDRGIGIAPEDADRLFERFYRVDGTARATPGVGLGLFICKRIVEAHGGRIWVSSVPGAGSTFSFTLPAVTDTVANGAQQGAAVAMAELLTPTLREPAA
jgi:signal transduction histidine kinase/HAMP domain-containing protein